MSDRHPVEPGASDDLAREVARLAEELASVSRELERRNRALEVEAALEKVRSRAVAMSTSAELSDTSAVLFQQLKVLGIAAERASVGIFDDPNGAVELWTTFSNRNEEVKVLDYVNVHIHPVFEDTIAARASGKPFSLTVLNGEEVRLYYETMFTILRSGETREFAKREYFYSFFFPAGMLTLIAYQALSEEECDVMERFARVFGLMYTRFLDLQKSEANARDARREASLSRIRAEVASMRSRADLERITPLIWAELSGLGLEFKRCGVMIMDEDSGLVRAYLSTPDGKAIASVSIPYDVPLPLIREGVAHWRAGSIYTEYWEPEDFALFWEHIRRLDPAADTLGPQIGDVPDCVHLHMLPFLQGMLYVGGEVPFEDDELELLQSVAAVLATAYARYEDFSRLESAKEQVERSLEDLKVAQAQLVHSEKMASLGELTAGIAHEIQNPLNFVNNFAEVSRELLVEMKEEFDRGNRAGGEELAHAVMENLDKISRHGKRADSIVKGMLQHSRVSAGSKEATDLNALAEEYLGLCYHGFRAKDSSFQVAIRTDLDPDVGEVDVVPQDLGRVFLNLIANAFHAVSGRTVEAEAGAGYVPEVVLSSRRLNGAVEVSVRDNGPGIPDGVIDKIFQPFFSTKPAGQGTGLGLSLSYDIVTQGHGGELTVETSEGEGTAFTVRLPTDGRPGLD